MRAQPRAPIDLSRAGLGNFQRTKPRWVEALWMVAEHFLVAHPLQPSSRLRVAALRLFGARIGKNVIARPRLRVKFPWNLTIGDNSWIGEGAWIHNQGLLVIEDNCVVSQDVFLTTGSHDTRSTMDLIVKPITIRRGAWITSRSIILQGVEIGENTIITPGSVVRRSIPADSIAGGNPATILRHRPDHVDE